MTNHEKRNEVEEGRPVVGRTNQDAAVEIFQQVWASLGRLAPFLFIVGIGWLAYSQGKSEEQEQLNRAAERVTSLFVPLTESMQSQLSMIESVTELGASVVEMTKKQVEAQQTSQAELQKLFDRERTLQIEQAQLTSLKADASRLAKALLQTGYVEGDQVRLALKHFELPLDTLLDAIRQFGAAPSNEAASMVFQEFRSGGVAAQLEEALSRETYGFACWFGAVDHSRLIGVHSLGAEQARWVVAIEFDESGYASNDALSIYETIEYVAFQDQFDHLLRSIAAVGMPVNYGNRMFLGMLGSQVTGPEMAGRRLDALGRVISGDSSALVLPAPRPYKDYMNAAGLDPYNQTLFYDPDVIQIALFTSAEKIARLESPEGLTAEWSGPLRAYVESLVAREIGVEKSIEGRFLASVLHPRNVSFAVKPSPSDTLRLETRSTIGGAVQTWDLVRDPGGLRLVREGSYYP